jgi:lipopolysaccharide export system permease protein
VLLNGRRYEGVGGTPDYKIMDFERYSIRMQPYEAGQIALNQKSLSTLMLLRDRLPVNMGELLWRLGFPISAFILALLAIPLSFVNPRAGRSLNLILALLLYMIYSNFISITQAWVSQSKLSPYIGLWLVHAMMVGVLLLLFYRRLVLAPFWMVWLKRLTPRLRGERP